MKNFVYAVLAASFVSFGLTSCNGGQQLDSREATLGYSHFIGAMHEHSGYSDGDIGSTPADYFAAGKELGLDFVAGAEHSDNARLPLTTNTDCLSPELLDCITLPPEGFQKWDSTKELASAATDGTFTAIRGFEWTSDRFGHISVYFSENDLNAKLEPGYLLFMDIYWFWFGLSPDSLGGADGVMVFNHPGREDLLHSACDNLGPLAATCGTVINPDPGYTWNDFDYRADIAERAVGIELFGKSNHYYDGDNGAPVGGWYAHALGKGWHLGPIGAEDEHGREWAQASRAKTVVLADDRSHDSLKTPC